MNKSNGLTPRVFWTPVPGQIQPSDDILLVRASSHARASELFGDRACYQISECVTPHLVRQALEYDEEEVWTTKVDKFPSAYDQFNPLSPTYMVDLEQAGFDIS